MTAISARPLNHWDIAKIIGLMLMFVDHSGVFFFPHEQWLRGIGRGAAPVFLFLAGYAASYRFKWQILVMAVLLSISDFLLVGHLRTQNILYTIIGCRLVFYYLEKRGKKIEHPFEWYVGSVALLFTIVLSHYGTLGLMLAVCGYMKRRPDYYTPHETLWFFRVSFATYAVMQVVLSGFSSFTTLLTALTVYGVYRLLLAVDTSPVDASRYPARLLQFGKALSSYSLYIYAFHLIALEWLTGVAF